MPYACITVNGRKYIYDRDTNSIDEVSEDDYTKLINANITNNDNIPKYRGEQL